MSIIFLFLYSVIFDSLRARYYQINFVSRRLLDTSGLRCWWLLSMKRTQSRRQRAAAYIQSHANRIHSINNSIPQGSFYSVAMHEKLRRQGFQRTFVGNTRQKRSLKKNGSIRSKFYFYFSAAGSVIFFEGLRSHRIRARREGENCNWKLLRLVFYGFVLEACKTRFLKSNAAAGCPTDSERPGGNEAPRK